MIQSRILYFLLAILLLVSCKNETVADAERIILQTNTGQFLSANRNTIPYITGDREHIRDWELFKVKKLNDSLFGITDFENNPLFILDNNLCWEWGQELQTFKIDQDGERAYLKTANGYYLEEEQNKIKISSKPGIVVHQLPNKNVFGGYIQNFDLLLIGISFLLFAFLLFNALFNWPFKLGKWTYLLLFIAHLFIAYFAVTEFDLLAPWDEQFHALVARNLSMNPLVPKLFPETILYPTSVWAGSEIWLHKQPLFLYQMALAIKIFGINIFSIRFPSMLLMGFMGPIIYRLGALVYNRTIGLIASLLFCFSFYKIQLLFGLIPTDHNDTVFLFYVTASIWALFEYLKSRSKGFFTAIFIFAAAAILTKWLVGLLVYLIWGLFILYDKKAIKSNLIELFKNVAFTFSLVLPWQIYTLIRFPEIAKKELALNASHFTEVIENHQQSWDFYLQFCEQHFGFNYWIIGLLLFFAYFSSKQKTSYYAMVSGVLFVYLFYGLAATKMQSFTYVVAGLVSILIAAGIYNLYWSILHFHTSKAKIIKAGFLIACIVLGAFQLNVSVIEYNYVNPRTGNHLLIPSTDHLLFKDEIQSKKYRQVGIEHPGPAILFNCPYVYHISAMFFNPNLIAYNTIPSVQDIEYAQKSGRELLIFDNGNLPDYIIQNTLIKKIPNY